MKLAVTKAQRIAWDVQQERGTITSSFVPCQSPSGRPGSSWIHGLFPREIPSQPQVDRGV